MSLHQHFSDSAHRAHRDQQASKTANKLTNKQAHNLQPSLQRSTAPSEVLCLCSKSYLAAQTNTYKQLITWKQPVRKTKSQHSTKYHAQGSKQTSNDVAKQTQHKQKQASKQPSIITKQRTAIGSKRETHAPRETNLQLPKNETRAMTNTTIDLDKQTAAA